MFRTDHYRLKFRASWNHSRSSHHISFIYTLISGYIPTNEEVFQKFSLPWFPNKILYIFVFQWMLVRVWSISSYLIQSHTSNTVTYSYKFSGSHSSIIEDSSRLGCHIGRLGVLVPWKRRNYILSKLWVPHIQRHNTYKFDVVLTVNRR